MRKAILIGLVLCLAAGGYWFFRGGGEEGAIIRRLDALVELVEKKGSVSTFETLGRARKVVAFFAPEAAIEYYPSRALPQDLEAMQGAFVQTWGSLDSATVWIRQHNVALDASGESAISTFKAISRIRMDGEERMSETVDYEIEWAKADGKWKVEHVRADYQSPERR